MKLTPLQNDRAAGANPNGPPPFMVTSAPSGSGAPNS